MAFGWPDESRELNLSRTGKPCGSRRSKAPGPADWHADAARSGCRAVGCQGEAVKSRPAAIALTAMIDTNGAALGARRGKRHPRQVMRTGGGSGGAHLIGSIGQGRVQGKAARLQCRPASTFNSVGGACLQCYSCLGARRPPQPCSHCAIHLYNEWIPMRNTLKNLFGPVPLACGLLASGIAQGQVRLPFHAVTIQAGTSFATWGGDAVKFEESAGHFSYSYLAGLDVRASALRSLNDNFALQFGIGYVQKGTSLRLRNPDNWAMLGGNAVEDRVRSNYLELPVLLRAGPNLGGPLSPHVRAGYVLSFRLDRAEREIRKVENGIMAGVGLDIAVSGVVSLTTGFLYDYSLQPIFDSDDLGEHIGGIDIRNRAFSISVGAMIPLRHTH